MATVLKQSEVIASRAISRLCAIESGRCEAGRAPPPAAAAEDVRRSADGWIDFEFYTARAHAIRGAAIARLAGALKQTMRTALARFYAVIRAKRSR